MKTVTATELQGNIYNLLDEILNTGIPIEINRGNKKLKLKVWKTQPFYHNVFDRKVLEQYLQIYLLLQVF